jgi:excinuclease ABC subunit B
MYADNVTDSMARALDETNRRRAIQVSYNEEHGIEPHTIIKEVRDLTGELAARREALVAEEKSAYEATASLPQEEMSRLVRELEKQMKAAAQALEFEKAAVLRDQIMEMRQLMVLKEASKGKASALPAWERLRAMDAAGIEPEG